MWALGWLAAALGQARVLLLEVLPALTLRELVFGLVLLAASGVLREP